MKEIRLIAVGKLPPKLEKIVEQSVRRASDRVRIRISVVPDLSDRDARRAVKEESDMILERLDRPGCSGHSAGCGRVILFDVHGTDTFRESDLEDGAVFVIGGSNGVDDRVKKRANRRVSVSGLTYPHGLFRLLVLEMISGSRDIK